MAQHGRVGSSDSSIEVVLSKFVGVVAQVRRVVPDVAGLTWGLQYRQGQRITTHPLAPTSAVGHDRDAKVAAIGALELPVHLLASICGPTVGRAPPWRGRRDTVTLMAEVVPWLLRRGQVLMKSTPIHKPSKRRLASPDRALPVSGRRRRYRRRGWAAHRLVSDLSRCQVSVDGEDVEIRVAIRGAVARRRGLFLSSG
ncbi:MAG: hypothetical protein IPG46_18470, partial [Actinobacteria bacterium]|nr:hypothetical protein [Actinomycetota bacterium]